MCGIRTLDLCDTGAALYQLSEQANRGRSSFIRFDIKDDGDDDHNEGVNDRAGVTPAGQGEGD